MIVHMVADELSMNPPHQLQYPYLQISTYVDPNKSGLSSGPGGTRILALFGAMDIMVG
jgi:hypothetical protein